MGAVVAPIAAPVIAMRADGACRVTAAAIAMRADGARRVTAAARRSAMRRRVEGGDKRARLEQVKSSQVKSSQVKSNSKWRSPIRLLWCPSLRDRVGRSRHNRHHWIAPSRGIIPIVLFLIIAAPQGFNFVPFSGSLQYGKATRLQADDGSDRGPARGLFRWAKASVGSGDRRRRVSSALQRAPPHKYNLQRHIPYRNRNG